MFRQVAAGTVSEVYASDTVLSLRHIVKWFGPKTCALSDVSLDVRPATVHGLLGGNGAGKSTLIKVISGAVQPDAGEMVLDGRPISPGSPLEAQEAGIRTIHQDLGLVDTMSVRENVFLGSLRQQGGGLPLVSQEELERRLAPIAARFPSGEFPDGGTMVSELNMRRRYLVAIGRALAADARLIIMDEPTAGLDHADVDSLLEIIRQLRAIGTSVLLVTHRLAEVEAVCDEVTVLRDGEVAGSGRTSDVPLDQLRRWIVRSAAVSASGDRTRGRRIESTPLLEVEIDDSAGLGPIHLRVGGGEIVALVGAVGSGRTRLLETILGAIALKGGRMTLNGKQFAPRNPTEAISAGVAMLPKDRRRNGLFINDSVRENLTVQSLTRRPIRSFLGTINLRAEERVADELVSRHDIVVSSLAQRVGELSGGNQQKVLLGRARALRPLLWLVNQPSAGLDIGAQAQFAQVLREVAATGAGVIVADEDLEFLLPVCDRAVVLKDGAWVAELDGNTPPEKVLEAAL